jgi:hypothetical protein
MGHREGEPTGGVRQIRVTTSDGKNITVTVEYQDGFALVILADQQSMPLSLDPAAAKIQVANQLKELGTDLMNIEPDQIIIEWPAAEQKGCGDRQWRELGQSGRSAPMGAVDAKLSTHIRVIASSAEAIAGTKGGAIQCAQSYFWAAARPRFCFRSFLLIARLPYVAAAPASTAIPTGGATPMQRRLWSHHWHR